MSKPRRTAPPTEPRSSRSTVEVRPSWLEELGPSPEGDAAQGDAARGVKIARRSRPAQSPRVSDVAPPSQQRPTIEVQSEWLELGSRPPPSARGGAATPMPSARGKPGKGPPPLPLEPAVDEEPSRRAMPPPLPPAGKARKGRT